METPQWKLFAGAKIQTKQARIAAWPFKQLQFLLQSFCCTQVTLTYGKQQDKPTWDYLAGKENPEDNFAENEKSNNSFLP